MPDKRSKIIFFLGSPGSGKTSIAHEISSIPNSFKVNKDTLASSLKIKKGPLNYLSPAINSEFETDSLYSAMFELVKYNFSSPSPEYKIPTFEGKIVDSESKTAILEGNFGKRLTINVLKSYLNDLSAYDFCLVHVICSNRDVQHNRVLSRKDIKDKAIFCNGKTYDITNRKFFDAYCEIRAVEEKYCIEAMSKHHMPIITIDNKTDDPFELGRLASSLKEKIARFDNGVLSSPEPLVSPNAIPRRTSSASLSLSSPIRKPLTTPNVSPVTGIPMINPSVPPILELGDNNNYVNTNPGEVKALTFRKAEAEITTESEKRLSVDPPFLALRGRAEYKKKRSEMKLEMKGN